MFFHTVVSASTIPTIFVESPTNVTILFLFMDSANKLTTHYVSGTMIGSQNKIETDFVKIFYCCCNKLLQT